MFVENLIFGLKRPKLRLFFQTGKKKGRLETLPYERGYYRLLDYGHVDGLLALGSGANFELDCLTFIE